MRRVRYAVGMSLDGFIADDRGATNWLVSDPTHDARPFFASIDVVLMGRRTFKEAVRQGLRAYPKIQNYVFSQTLRPADYPDVTLVTTDAAAFVGRLRQEPGKDIWLSGGGLLFRSLLEAGLVDSVEVGVSPLLLGRPGIPMLPPSPVLPDSVRLELTRHTALPTGLLILEYAVRRA